LHHLGALAYKFLYNNKLRLPYPMTNQQLDSAKVLSPKRKSSEAETIEELALEQLAHLGIEADSQYGQVLKDFASNLYEAKANVDQLWQITSDTLAQLDDQDRIAYFNAKKFLSFQLAKILDTLQNPFRSVYQSMNKADSTKIAKGHYPLFDNVSAIFSATPVVVRTATYIYACTEWIDDAFHGKEFTHQIYSRLLNPTNVALANAIVELEAGENAADYMAWNFNSGMAAIDALLSNVLNHGDVLLISRNIYGGVYQLVNDYFAQENRLNIQVAWFDGYSEAEFRQRLKEVKGTYAQELDQGAQLHVYLESPCNPHGYVLDVAGISKAAHEDDHLVMVDSTLATPVLATPLQHKDKACRPDYIVHSYTKDISGTGDATAGVVIGEAYRMFIPKGDTANGLSWQKSMFWDVYYIKGAFLDSEKAFDVFNGMKTMHNRVISKAINAKVLATFLSSHPMIRVNSSFLANNENHDLAKQQMKHGLGSALFTMDMEQAKIPRDAFVRFFDSLEPAFSHMVSIGQTNTMVLCPALTSHSELSPEALKDAHIYLTTIRISTGNEDVRGLIAHFVQSAKLHLDPIVPGFSEQFMAAVDLDGLLIEETLRVHETVIRSQPTLASLLSS